MTTKRRRKQIKSGMAETRKYRSNARWEQVGGKTVRLYTMMLVLETLRISRRRVERWIRLGALPPPTAVDENEVEWFSEDWVKFVQAVLGRIEPRDKARLSADKVASLVDEQRRENVRRREEG